MIHRRDDFGQPAENFNRDWNDYKNGFGDPSKEFWLGNENIYMLTNNDDYMIRVELEDFDGNKRSVCYVVIVAPNVMSERSSGVREAFLLVNGHRPMRK